MFATVLIFSLITVVLPCSDLINPSTGLSDCPSKSILCTNSDYYELMTIQCPKTCGRCASTTTSSSSSTTTCSDKINPSTGVSDCLRLSYLCTNTIYSSLMSIQCPKTCGLCNTTSTVTSSSTTVTSCQDLTNSATGQSDCAQRIAYCTNLIYQPLMKTQCPKTCGFCA